MSESAKAASTIYQVVMNLEEQYSIWLLDRPVPEGWTKLDKTGTKETCLAFIKEAWADMRPRSLREKVKDE